MKGSENQELQWNGGGDQGKTEANHGALPNGRAKEKDRKHRHHHDKVHHKRHSSSDKHHSCMMTSAEFLEEHNKSMEGGQLRKDHGTHRRHHKNRHRKSVSDRNPMHDQQIINDLEGTLEKSEELCYGCKEDDEPSSGPAGTYFATPALGLTALDEDMKYLYAASKDKDAAGGTVQSPGVAVVPGDLKEDAPGETMAPGIDIEAPPLPPGEEKLPVASSVAPPPELLKRIRELEDAQEHMPKAVLMDVDEERRKLRKRRCMIGSSIVIVAAIIAVVFGVILGTRSGNDVEKSTESPIFTALKDMVVSVWPESAEALLDLSSPQYAALSWLENNANLGGYPEWKRIQRYSLAVFFYSTNGYDWKVQGSWMSDDDECTWPSSAVDPVCNNETAFLRLQVWENNVVGPLPSELALLSNSLSK